jgi:hypothetical protein
MSIQNGNALQPADPAVALIHPAMCQAAGLPNVRGGIYCVFQRMIVPSADPLARVFPSGE